MAHRPPHVIGSDGLAQRLQSVDTLSTGARTRTTTLAVANAEAALAAQAVEANSLVVGSVLRFTAWGLLTNAAMAPATVLRLRLGPTTLSGAVVASATLSMGTVARTNVPFCISGAFTVLAIGTSGTAIGQLVVTANTATALGDTTAPVTAAVTVNTTVATLAELTLISGATTTTWTVQAAVAERIS